MNAGIYYQTVTPILAIVATPNFKKQHDNPAHKKSQKKRTSFSSYPQTTDLNDDIIIYEPTGCYGANGKPVVRNASCFSKAL